MSQLKKSRKWICCIISNLPIKLAPTKYKFLTFNCTDSGSIFRSFMKKWTSWKDHYQTMLRVCPFLPMIIWEVLNNSGFCPTGYIYLIVRWMWVIFIIPKEVTISFYLGLFWNAVSDTERKKSQSAFWFSLRCSLSSLLNLSPSPFRQHLLSGRKDCSYWLESRIGHTVGTN